MRYILNFIKSIFYQRKFISNNTIIFSVDTDNNNDFKLEINHYSKEAAEKFGVLLFLINEGYYVQSILDSLSSLSKENEEKSQFVQQAIYNWSSHIKASDGYSSTNDEPIVKPTQFNTTK